jgi:hypothetical protein
MPRPATAASPSATTVTRAFYTRSDFFQAVNVSVELQRLRCSDDSRFPGSSGGGDGGGHTSCHPIVIRPDAPWEKGCLIESYSSVLYRAGRYELFYSLTGGYVTKHTPQHQPCVGVEPSSALVGVAYSTDGVTFTKPILDRVKFRNSTQNNLVSGLGSLRLEGCSISYDDKTQRYTNIAKTTVHMPKAPEGSGLILSTSADGTAWTTEAVWLLRPHADDDTQSVLRFDQPSQLYQLYTWLWIRPTDPSRRQDSYRTVRRLTAPAPLTNASVFGHEIDIMRPDAADMATHPSFCGQLPNGSTTGVCKPPIDYYGGTVYAPPNAPAGTLLMLTQRTWHWSPPDGHAPQHATGGLAMGCRVI